MKQKFLVSISILAILALSACGGADATPEIRSEDLAATAVAEAWVIITQTAAAVPSATPVPPTFTPQPTATLAPVLELLPTQPAPVAVVAATATPECNQIPVAEPKGTLVNVEFYSEALGSANLAFGMLSPNDKGECYTYSFSVGRGDVLSAQVVAGCYWGYAWITGEEESVARSGDKVMCITDASIIYKVKITKESIDFK